MPNRTRPAREARKALLVPGARHRVRWHPGRLLTTPIPQRLLEPDGERQGVVPAGWGTAMQIMNLVAWEISADTGAHAVKTQRAELNAVGSHILAGTEMRCMFSSGCQKPELEIRSGPVRVEPAHRARRGMAPDVH